MMQEGIIPQKTRKLCQHQSRYSQSSHAHHRKISLPATRSATSSDGPLVTSDSSHANACNITRHGTEASRKTWWKKHKPWIVHWNTTTAYQPERTGSCVMQGGKHSEIQGFYVFVGSTQKWHIICPPSPSPPKKIKSGKLVHMGIWWGPREKGGSKNCRKHEIREHKIVVFYS
jgi:hypothetical protein